MRKSTGKSDSLLVRPAVRPRASILSLGFRCIFGLLAVLCGDLLTVTAPVQAEAPHWDLSTASFPSQCQRTGAIVECDVVEGVPISMTLPRAVLSNVSVVSYSLTNQPAYSTFDPGTGIFTWTPFFSSVNQRALPDGLAADLRMYLFSNLAGLSNFGIYFRVHDAARQPTKLAAPLLVNGEPFVPMIAVGIPETRFAEIRSLGFNTVTTVNFGGYFEEHRTDPGFDTHQAIAADIVVLQRYLSTARSVGLKVIVQHHVPEVVSAIKDDPALLAVLLPQDEPDYWLDSNASRYHNDIDSPTRMRAMRDAIRAVAPQVKVCAVFTARFSGVISYPAETPAFIDSYRDYFEIPDIIFFDYYLQGASSDYSRVGDPRYFAGMVEEALDLVSDEKPVIPYIEATKVYSAIFAASDPQPLTSDFVKPQIRAVLEAGAAGFALFGGHNVTGATPSHQAWDISVELRAALPQILDAVAEGATHISVAPNLNEPLPGVDLLRGIEIGVQVDPVKIGASDRLSYSYFLPSADSGSAQRVDCRNTTAGVGACLADGVRIMTHQSSAQFGRVVVRGDGDAVSVRYFRMVPGDLDYCPSDGSKTLPGLCGCGVSEADSDGDGVPDCVDLCPEDPTTSGACPLRLQAAPRPSVRWRGVTPEFLIPEIRIPGAFIEYKLSAERQLSRVSGLVTKNRRFRVRKSAAPGTRWLFSYRILSADRSQTLSLFSRAVSVRIPR